MAGSFDGTGFCFSGHSRKRMGTVYPFQLHPIVSNEKRIFLFIHRPIRFKCFNRLWRPSGDEISRQSWPLFCRDAHGSTMPVPLVFSGWTLARFSFFTPLLKTTFPAHKNAALSLNKAAGFQPIAGRRKYPSWPKRMSLSSVPL